jgi:hypothetical protein
MTILKEGTPKTYIYECGECGCIFTGDSSEVDTWDSVMGISFPVMYCPCCHEKRVTGDVVTEEELKDIIEKLESDEE